MRKRATRTIDPLDGPVDFSRFGPLRRNAFAGKTLVEQHQVVYRALGKLMPQIHALSLRTEAP